MNAFRGAVSARWLRSIAVTGAGLLLSGLVAAQQPARVQAPRATDPIPVVRVAPKVDARASVEAPARPAAPLSVDAKLKALMSPKTPAGGGEVAKKADPKLTSITLTAKNPFASNRGFLLFNESRHVDTDANFVLWYHPQNSGMGYVQGRLNLEKGKRYLADMNISCEDPQTFSYGGQQVSVQGGSHHLLLLLEPEASGWTTLMLSNDNSWAFHSLEVTMQE